MTVTKRKKIQVMTLLKGSMGVGGVRLTRANGMLRLLGDGHYLSVHRVQRRRGGEARYEQVGLGGRRSGDEAKSGAIVIRRCAPPAAGLDGWAPGGHHHGTWRTRATDTWRTCLFRWCSTW